MDYIVDAIVEIANHPKIIEHCEPNLIWHSEIQKWMVERILYAQVLIGEELNGVRQDEQGDTGLNESKRGKGVPKVSKKRNKKA